MTLGMIVRCDQGGLANQTHLLWRHLEPAVTVLIRQDKPRGVEHPEWYGDAIHTREQLDRRSLAALKACDRVLTVETVYGHVDAARWKLDVALIANPELFNPVEPHDRLGVHTGWLAESLPSHCQLVGYPAPVDTYSHRTDIGDAFYHPAAPAMADRNGTGALLSALARTTVPAELVIRSDEQPPWPGTHTRERIGAWTVRWVQERTADPADAYPAECGTLLLPRRYGGMCLPVWEAACLGWDAAMLTREADRNWPHVELLEAGPLAARPIAMRGGRIAVVRPHNDALARSLDELAGDAQRRTQRRSAAADFVHEQRWDRIRHEYDLWLS